MGARPHLGGVDQSTLQSIVAVAGAHRGHLEAQLLKDDGVHITKGLGAGNQAIQIRKLIGGAESVSAASNNVQVLDVVVGSLLLNQCGGLSVVEHQLVKVIQSLLGASGAKPGNAR